MSYTCGFLDIRTDAIRNWDSTRDNFPCYSVRLRNALKCEIRFLYEQGVRDFCVCENNDSDVTFFRLISEVEETYFKRISKTVYYSPTKNSLAKQLALYANCFELRSFEGPPQSAMFERIDFLILIDDAIAKKLRPKFYRFLLDTGVTIHRIQGLSLDFSIDYPVKHNYLRELPHILKKRDLSLIRDCIEFELRCREDEIHSAKMYAILRSVPIEQENEFIEKEKMHASKLSEEIAAIEYMQTHPCRSLEAAYWKAKKSELENKDTLDYENFYSKYIKHSRPFSF